MATTKKTTTQKDIDKMNEQIAEIKTEIKAKINFSKLSLKELTDLFAKQEITKEELDTEISKRLLDAQSKPLPSKEDYIAWLTDDNLLQPPIVKIHLITGHLIKKYLGEYYDEFLSNGLEWINSFNFFHKGTDGKLVTYLISFKALLNKTSLATTIEDLMTLSDYYSKLDDDSNPNRVNGYGYDDYSHYVENK